MARIIDFYDGADSTLTPVIGNIVTTSLIDYPDDATYESANLGSPVNGNIYFNTTDNTVRYYDGTSWIEVGRALDIQANADDIADIRTTTGTSDGDTDMGSYTGALLSPNESTKENIQELSNAIEQNASDISDNALDIADNAQESADIRTTLGSSNGDTDMGSYTGSIITDNTDQHSINQELSDAIEAIPAGLSFQGNWDANTNSPTLVSSTGTAGHYYNVSVAGTTNLDGETDWNLGDWAVFTDTGVWQRIDNSESVKSVNGNTGIVSLDTDDIPEGTNEYYTDTKVDTVISNTSIDALSDVDTSTVPPAADEVLKWNGLKWVPGIGGGSGSGVGGKNYILDDAFNFEGGTIGDWSVYADAPGFEPVDGVGLGSTSDVNNTGYVDGGDSSGQVSDTVWRAQSFEAGVTGNYNKVSVDGITQSSASGSSIVMEILDYNSGVPDGSVLGTSTAIDISTLPSSVGTTVDFIFPTPVAVTSSTNYWWRIRTLASYSGSVDIYFDATDNYSGFTSSESSDSGANWADDVSGYDFDFITYYESSDITFTAVNDSSIRDAWVGELSKPATNAQGQGISYDFSIDPADKNSSLYWSFDFLNLISLINDETITFWVRDITAGINYRIIPKNGLSQFTSIFYTSENTDYRLMIHISGTDGSAYDFSLDTIICGPDKIIDSPIVEYMGNFAATLSNNTNVFVNRVDYWRVDDSVKLSGYFEWNGAGAGSTFSASMPPGLTINDSRLPIGTSTNNHLGTATWYDNGTGFKSLHIKKESSTNSTGVVFVEIGANNIWDGSQAAAGDIIFFQVTVPVLEWANQSAIFSDKQLLNQVSASRRVVDTTGQSVPNAITSIIDFQVEDASTGNITWQSGSGYNSSLGTWTVNPGFKVHRTGWYSVEGNVTMQSMNATSAHIGTIMVNGSSKAAANYNQASDVSHSSRSGHTNLYLQKDDVVSYAQFHNHGSARTVRSSSGGSYSWFSIVEKPDFSFLAAYNTPNKTQTKYLTSAVTSGTTISDLTFSNLTVGKYYSLKAKFYLTVNDGSSDIQVAVDIKHDGATLDNVDLKAPSSTSPTSVIQRSVLDFKATATTLTFDAFSPSTDSFIAGNGTSTQTFVTLTEIQPLQETNEW